jgi:C4-dicarboxylate transporter, DctM subunit
MSPIDIGIMGGVFLVLMFALGMPIAYVFVLVGVVGFAAIVSPSAAFSLLTRNLFTDFADYPLSSILLFVLMGNYAFAAGMGKKLFSVTYATLGHIAGGLTCASIAACTLFGAVCGSASATCATIGKMALPEMKRYGYSDSLATGTIAASGPLGVLIPPSVPFIVYGILTEQSIGKLFLAGIVPGVVIALLLMATVWVMCRHNPRLGPPGPRTSWSEKARSFAALIDSGLLFIFTVGGLLLGWFGPTQAGSIGAAGALLIGIVRREITWQKFWEVTKDSVQLSCMIMMLVITAKMLGRFMAVTGIPAAVIGYAESGSLSPLAFMIFLCILWYILGCFLDGFAIIILLMPLVYPIIVKFGFDPIWFGVIVVVLNHIGLMTPPVGLASYVTQTVADDVPLETVFKGTFPLLIPITVALVIFLLFPQVITFLPKLVYR